ncbi:MAG: hypothetical protein M1840_008467 [Geoglossum simile]|nr:MAG: hypothetical protein M1840_008467 [Geoglossum simile]
MNRSGSCLTAGDQSVSNKAEEESVVKSLSGKRTHFTTDGIPEVGVNYLPTDIVELDLDAEEQGNEAIEDIEPKVLEPDLTGGTEFPTALPATGFDPTKRQKIWVWEGYVRMGVPLMFHDWEENLRDRGKGAPSKTAERRKGRPVTKTGMKAGALEPFLKPMKPGMSSSRAGKPDRADRPSTPAFIDPVSKTRNRLFEELDIQKASEKPKSGNLRVKGKENRTRAASPIASATHSRSRRTNPGVFPNEDHFILAKRPPNAPSVPLPPESRSLVLDKYNPSKGVSDPRRERCSNREEPKCANGDRNLASLKGSCGAFRGYRSPSLREPFSVGSGSSRKCSPPNLEHIEDGPSGSTTNRPSQSKEKAPTKHRSGPTIENCIDLSESPPPRPPSGHRASYLVTSHFEGNGPTSALAESELNRRPDFHPSTEIFPAEDQPASSPSTPLIPTPQPRNPPQRPKAKFPPTPSPPPSCLGLSQSNRETSSVQISGLGSQTTVAKVVRMVAPRESLAGAWKEVDELESRTRSNVFVRVEVLDMTDDGL